MARVTDSIAIKWICHNSFVADPRRFLVGSAKNLFRSALCLMTGAGVVKGTVRVIQGKGFYGRFMEADACS